MRRLRGNPVMTWREYHEATKHSTQSLSRSQHFLDWANMPDPFRHYEGVPLIDLPANPPAPGIPVTELLQGVHGNTSSNDGPTFLSQLLYYSAAISASKRAPSGDRYALRVNPSSGNLHPTEFHFLTRSLREWPDGLYHYRPSSHMAEQRAAGDLAIQLSGRSAPVVFFLTSIAWREAWKYGERAYRYCLHDIGHAWQALALAAGAIGCDSYAIGHFPDDEVARSCRLHADEWPMLIVNLYGGSIPLRNAKERTSDGPHNWFGGYANQLSAMQVTYPLIDEMHAATKRTAGERGDIPNPKLSCSGSGEFQLPPPASSIRAFAEIARMRRSALDFRGGIASISLAQLSAILAATARHFPPTSLPRVSFSSISMYTASTDYRPASIDTGPSMPS